MSTLQIALLGSMQVIQDGQPVTTFESDKVRALLAYLAVEADQPHRRETLAALLWPDLPESSARSNLRHALANLRHAINDYQADPPYLFITRQTIQFNRDSYHTLDISTLLKTEKYALQEGQEITGLYRGDFLTGFSLGDSIAFEEWIQVKREQCRRRMGRLLTWLVNTYEQRGQYEKALNFAHKQVELVPWDESAHQNLIRMLALADQRSAALAQYESCCQILAAELDVTPTAVTTALYESIRDETWPDETAKIPLPLYMSAATAVFPSPLFVAREQELGQLNSFLDQTRAGKSQVAFITGEAGSGKTALMHAFAQEAMTAHPDLLVVEGRCSAYTGSGEPYQPFLEIMQMLTGDIESRWEAGDISTGQARRLWAALPEVTEALMRNGRLLLDRFVSSASLLTRARVRTRSQLPDELPWLGQLTEWVEAKEMLAASSQMDLFEQVAAMLESMARRHPLLLLLDDLHWIDTGSLNLLLYLGQHLRNPYMMILCAYRPGDVVDSPENERHPLVNVVAELQQIFGPNQVDLSQVEGHAFINALLDSEPNRLDDDFRQTLLQQTGGQALFTVELLQGLQERGDLVKDDQGYWVNSPSLDWNTLPARAEAVIAGRINLLPENLRQALTIASVEGETFTAEVIAHLQNSDEQEIIHCLSGELSQKHRLVTGQSRQRLGQQHLSHYRFQHFLYQKYFYNNLDPVLRADLHEMVGDTLETFYEAQDAELATMFGQLAWHYQEAGVLDKAIAYLQKAGERAWQLSAADEAISHLQKGLALLEKLPDSPERKQRELNLQMSLLMPFQAAKGFAAPEFRDTCDRAYLLSQQVGQTPQLIVILSALGSYYLTSAQYRVGVKISQEKLELAQLFQDDLQIALTWLGLAANYTLLGEFVQSLDYTRKLLDFYDYRQHHALSSDHSIDPGVNGLIWAALVSWILGFPEQALQYRQEAIDLARVSEHVLTLTAAFEVSGAILHILSRNHPAAKKDLEASLQLASEHKLGLFQVESMFYQGFVLVTEGEIENGIAQMTQSLAAWKATGMRIMYTQMLGLLAEALGWAGQAEAGLQTIADALSEANNRDEHYFMAELYRIKGDLLQACGEDTAVVEVAYHQAIKYAQQQSAKSWELRTKIRLAKLWQDQGKVSQAKSMLTEICDWFTEGFYTPDLQEAMALLVAVEALQ